LMSIRRGGHGRIDINVRDHHHSAGRIQPDDFVSVQRRSDVGCLHGSWIGESYR